MTNYYSVEELTTLGIKIFGKNVLISRKTSILNPELLNIGNNVRIDDFVILSGNICIGSFVHIAPYTALFGKQKIEINDFAGISSRVSIYTESDDYVLGISLTNSTIPDKYRRIFDKGKVTLKKHALVGSGTIIMPDTVINEGTSVGALTLVRGDTEAWSVYSGNPAKKIGPRRSETILKLEKKLLEEYSLEGR